MLFLGGGLTAAGLLSQVAGPAPVEPPPPMAAGEMMMPEPQESPAAACTPEPITQAPKEAAMDPVEAPMANGGVAIPQLMLGERKIKRKPHNL